MSRYVTRSGAVLTDADLARLADLLHRVATLPHYRPPRDPEGPGPFTGFVEMPDEMPDELESFRGYPGAEVGYCVEVVEVDGFIARCFRPVPCPLHGSPGAEG